MTLFVLLSEPLSDDAPEDPTEDGALFEVPNENARWSFVGGPVFGRTMGVTNLSGWVFGVDSAVGLRSFRENMEVSKFSLFGFVVRGMDGSVRLWRSGCRS